MATAEPQPFGQLLKQHRKNLDLTQDQLAERVGCSPATIRLIEHGQRRPSRQIAVLLAECLRIPATEKADFLALARGVSQGADIDVAPQSAANETVTQIPSNLPAQLITLFGRGVELEAMESLLSRNDVHLLTLTGPPGVGKTSLALQIANSLSVRPFAADGDLPPLSDGIFWVALASLTGSEMVVPAIARVLDVQILGSQSLITALKQHLARKRMLLLLDNFEQVIQAAPQMADLLSACPNLKLLVTSREALHVRREQEYNVEPLALPDTTGTPSSETLAESPAVALFVERAQAVDVRFVMTRENAPLVAAICARLDGLPLAIELVAARTKMLPLKALLARLQSGDGQSSQLDLLSGGARDLPDRQRTLRDAISWSYSLLSGDEQILFRRLGVFLGGFTLPAAEAICNANSDLNLDLFEGISQLLHKNLLKRDITEEDHEETGGSRFSMLETIREYALELIRASGEEAALRLLHAEYFLGMASSLDLSLAIGENEKVLYRQLDRNRDNLRAALTATIDGGRMDVAAQFGVSLSRYWELRGYYTEGRDWLLRILSAQAATQPYPDAREKRAMLLMYAGRLSLHMSDYSTARTLLEECLLISSELGLDAWRQRAHYHLSLVAWMHGDYAAAQSLLEEDLRDKQGSGNKTGISSVFWMLGSVVGECGDFERAKTLLTDAIALAKEANDMFSVTGSTRDLGTTLCYEGRYVEAATLLEEALTLTRNARFEVGTTWILSALGLAVMGTGNYDRAEQHFRESLALARKIDKHRVPDCLEGLAEAELARFDGGGEQEHVVRAASLLGAAEGARGILNSAIIPVRAPVRERLMSQVRALVDTPSYERAYAVGQNMSLEEAISLGIG